jgi:hypothetical protein
MTISAPTGRMPVGPTLPRGAVGRSAGSTLSWSRTCCRSGLPRWAVIKESLITDLPETTDGQTFSRRSPTWFSRAASTNSGNTASVIYSPAGSRHLQLRVQNERSSANDRRASGRGSRSRGDAALAAEVRRQWRLPVVGGPLLGCERGPMQWHRSCARSRSCVGPQERPRRPAGRCAALLSVPSGRYWMTRW